MLSWYGKMSYCWHQIVYKLNWNEWNSVPYNFFPVSRHCVIVFKKNCMWTLAGQTQSADVLTRTDDLAKTATRPVPTGEERLRPITLLDVPITGIFLSFGYCLEFSVLIWHKTEYCTYYCWKLVIHKINSKLQNINHR